MVATKFYSGHDDEAPHLNWAECIDNVLEMELSFLDAINWKVYVSREQFFEKVKSLEIVLARQQGLKHGFFTYLEMNSVMPSIDDVTYLIQSIIVLGFSYTVFVATMIASVFLVSQIPVTCLHKQIQSTSIQTTVSMDTTIVYPILIDDLTVILNEDIDEYRREKANATTWIPIILSSERNVECSGMNFSVETYMERFKSSIDGIKMHWV